MIKLKTDSQGCIYLILLDRTFLRGEPQLLHAPTYGTAQAPKLFLFALGFFVHE